MPMKAFQGRRLRALLCSLAVAFLAPAVAGGAPKPADVFSRGGFDGSGRQAMQPVSVPARVARVAAVPGTAEVWGIGLSTAVLPGWDAGSPGGQVVFLRYTPKTGWTMEGPPLDAAGRPANPTLTAIAMAPNGEGWAVGEEGVLIHHAPGQRWRIDRASGLVRRTLQGVSLGVRDGRTFGFAVGEDQTILRLLGASWGVDPGISAVVGDLIAVSAVSPETAWAVSGPHSTKALYLWHRESGVWRRVETGRAMFDSPPAATGGGATNSEARGASVAATPFGVWVGGSMFPSDVPSDANNPFGDESVGDRSRPFAIWRDARDGSVTTYCPDQYSFGQYGQVNAARLCDRPFPLGGFDLTSMTAFPGPDGGEVLAGGLGLFHFRDGGWFREPDVNGYLISVSFGTPREGWTASSGNTYGAGGAVHSSTTVLGHWTARPATPRVARWAQPNREVLEAVAFDTTKERVLAVGQHGHSVLYDRDGVWDVRFVGTQDALHAVAWPGEAAWGVGGRGTIARFDGSAWSFDEGSQQLTRQPLFGVAFRGPSDGVAVGGGGTILRYDGTRWAADPASRRATSEALYGVAATGSGYVAVGAKGTVLVERDGTWRAVGGIEAWLKRGARAPADLFAVASTGGAEVAIGGANAVLLVGRPDRLAPFPHPIEGTVVALDGSRAAGTLRLLVSVGEEEDKFAGDRLAITSAGLQAFDGRRWIDVQLAQRRTLFATYEPSAPVDPAVGIALEAGGARGWAVGGIVPNSLDSNNYVQADPTSSIYRFDLAGDPRQPDTATVPRIPEKGLTFAFFGETGCGRGLCGATVGSGVKGDVVAGQIQDEINALAARPGGPAFALFGGNSRRIGMPEEVAQFRGFLEEFEVPAFAAIGDLDLFKRTKTTVPPRTPGGSIIRSALPSDNRFYLETFASEIAPWGTSGRAHPRFRPVAVAEQAPVAGLARSHYAYDYLVDGKPALRVAVLDSSNRSLDSQGQNPQQDQLSWLSRVLAPAKLAGEPSIVVLNQPTFNTVRGFPQPNWGRADTAIAFHGVLVANGVSAVFASGIRVNLTYSASAQGSPGSVPIYVLGTGGAPLEETREPLDGFYHSWQLVTVDLGAKLPPLGQSRVVVQSVPVLESIALHAPQGRVAAAGTALEFEALARAPAGGTSDLEQSRAIYLKFPRPVTCSGPGLQRGACASREAVHPAYRFWVEDPKIAQFVKPDDGRPGTPFRNAGGRVVPDDQSGFLCTFTTGTTYVNIESGMRRARVPITVRGGVGPCVEAPVPEPPVSKAPVVEERRIVQQPQDIPRRFSPKRADTAVAIFPPPPAPVVAPAPPGAPGVGRKEEHEPSHETEGHGQTRYPATALAHRPAADPVAQSWAVLGGVAVLSFMGAAVAAAKRERRPAWQRERGVERRM